MEKTQVLFLLKRHLPQPISKESLEVLMMAIAEVTEEHPDREEWQEGIWDLLADDTGLLDLLDEDEDDPETSELSEAVAAAAEAITQAAFENK